MTQLTKQLRFDPEVLDVLAGADWDPSGTLMKKLPDLDRALYEKVDKALKTMGGKWNRKANGHLFAADPRPLVDGLLKTGELTVERMGFFETPVETAALMADYLNVLGLRGVSVLEPSAGTGRLCEAVYRLNPTAEIEVFELNGERRERLATDWRVMGADFMTPTPEEIYDRVIMNPPFENQQSLVHTLNAFDWLKPGGWLVGIVAPAAFYSQTAVAKEWRAWFTEWSGFELELPPGTFKESGTMVKAHLIVVHKVKTAQRS